MGNLGCVYLRLKKKVFQKDKVFGSFEYQEFMKDKDLYVYWDEKVFIFWQNVVDFYILMILLVIIRKVR